MEVCTLVRYFVTMKKFGLIGYPLSHSFSKKYFSEKFEKEGIKDCVYELYPIENIKLLPLLLDTIGDELIGLNCTIPYKQAVIPYLDELSSEAKAVEAVNTILFKQGKKFGFNTDIPGFKDCLSGFIPPEVNKALVLGFGGAAKAVIYVLNQMNIDYKIVSRKKSEQVLSYDEIMPEIIYNHPLIINTTPQGMYPQINTFANIDYHLLHSGHYLFDLVYNPAKTLFLQKGEDQGAHIMNGLPMLIGQAEAAWKIWNS